MPEHRMPGVYDALWVLIFFAIRFGSLCSRFPSTQREDVAN